MKFISSKTHLDLMKVIKNNIDKATIISPFINQDMIIENFKDIEEVNIITSKDTKTTKLALYDNFNIKKIENLHMKAEFYENGKTIAFGGSSNFTYYGRNLNKELDYVIKDKRLIKEMKTKINEILKFDIDEFKVI